MSTGLGVVVDRLLDLDNVHEVRICRIEGDPARTNATVRFRDGGALGATNKDATAAVEHLFTELRFARASMRDRYQRDLDILDRGLALVATSTGEG